LPEGLKVAEKPTKLDDALLGMIILMRWAAPHGWAVGKISTQITASTPRLFKNFNFRCTWTDGWTNLLLKLDEYNGGPAAPYGSWVLLEKASPAQGLQKCRSEELWQAEGCTGLRLRYRWRGGGYKQTAERDRGSLARGEIS